MPGVPADVWRSQALLPELRENNKSESAGVKDQRMEASAACILECAAARNGMQQSMPYDLICAASCALSDCPSSRLTPHQPDTYGQPPARAARQL